jgi:hypothetical protein
LEAINLNDPVLKDTHPLPDPELPLFDQTITEPPPPPPPGPDKLIEIEFRRFARNANKNLIGLELRGLRVGQRWAVIFSPHDLSVGMVGHSVDGIMGYTPATATEIARRIVVNSPIRAR